MSIYQYLKHDHQRFRNIIDQINSLSASDIDKRNELFNTLKNEIIVHSKAEEKVFYQPLQKESITEDDIPESQDEHKKVEEMLEQLSNSTLDNDKWHDLFQTMCRELLHHIDEEEQDVFPDAKKELNSAQAEDMEQAMKVEKQKIANTLDNN
jgi:hemerythrin superfamily protein